MQGSTEEKRTEGRTHDLQSLAQNACTFSGGGSIIAFIALLVLMAQIIYVRRKNLGHGEAFL